MLKPPLQKNRIIAVMVKNTVDSLFRIWPKRTEVNPGTK